MEMLRSKTRRFTEDIQEEGISREMNKNTTDSEQYVTHGPGGSVLMTIVYRHLYTSPGPGKLPLRSLRKFHLELENGNFLLRNPGDSEPAQGPSLFGRHSIVPSKGGFSFHNTFYQTKDPPKPKNQYITTTNLNQNEVPTLCARVSDFCAPSIFGR